MISSFCLDGCPAQDLPATNQQRCGVPEPDFGRPELDPGRFPAPGALIPDLARHPRHWLGRQVHRSWSRHRRSRRIRWVCVMEESPVHTPSPAQSFRHSSLPIFCCVVWKRFSFRACRNLALGAHIRVPGYSFTKHTIKCLGKVWDLVELRVSEAYSTSQPDAACQLHGRGDKKLLFLHVLGETRRVADIDISRHQRFEYDVQAGYCIQNSIQTNLLQAHSPPTLKSGKSEWVDRGEGKGGQVGCESRRKYVVIIRYSISWLLLIIAR